MNGFCECGCGTKTKLARQDYEERGWIKGQPLRFIVGHSGRGRILSEAHRQKLSIANAGANSISYKHGQGSHHTGLSPAYRSWRTMLRRCYNPNWWKYKNYGGRGITVCERWLGEQGFANFYADMGERPESKTLDRQEVNGNYEKDNCCWKTQKEQMNNTTRTIVPWKKWYSRAHWYNLRKLVLARDPICKMCNRAAATIADHIKPHKGVWELFSDLLNLQGLCAPCHSRKTANEDGGWGNSVFIGARSETPGPLPTGSKEGKEFQSSSISVKKLDKALEMSDDFLEGIPS